MNDARDPTQEALPCRLAGNPAAQSRRLRWARRSPASLRASGLARGARDTLTQPSSHLAEPTAKGTRGGQRSKASHARRQKRPGSSDVSLRPHLDEANPTLLCHRRAYFPSPSAPAGRSTRATRPTRLPALAPSSTRPSRRPSRPHSTTIGRASLPLAPATVACALHPRQFLHAAAAFPQVGQASSSYGGVSFVCGGHEHDPTSHCESGLRVVTTCSLASSDIVDSPGAAGLHLTTAPLASAQSSSGALVATIELDGSRCAGDSKAVRPSSCAWGGGAAGVWCGANCNGLVPAVLPLRKGREASPGTSSAWGTCVRS